MEEEKIIWMPTGNGEGRINIPHIQKLNKAALNKLKLERLNYYQKKAVEQFRNSDEVRFIEHMLKIRWKENQAKQKSNSKS